MLLSCRSRDGQPEYSVHKQGLLALRGFRNKKLRIIFNITHDQHPLSCFNSLFMGLDAQQQNQPVPDDGTTSFLRISQTHKQLSDNRVVLFVDAHEGSCNSHLVIFGYLVASVFLYHSGEPLSEDSRLTGMLAEARQMLSATNLQQLQQQIKYTSGCTKKPYFLCLFTQPGLAHDYHEHMREFYKYREGTGRLNEAVDALMDYFPERSGMLLGDYLTDGDSRAAVRKLGQEYMQNILGRQMFNFEITGSSLQNLCFELCDIFNSGCKSVDLTTIYSKIIDNQKTQVLDNTIEIYTNQYQELLRSLPYDFPELVEAHAGIAQYALTQSMDQASNCMTFPEYRLIYEQMRSLMEGKFRELGQLNVQKLRDRALKCYELLEDDPQFWEQLGSLNQGNYEPLLEVLNDKLLGFMKEVIPEGTGSGLLGRVINQYTDRLGQGIGQALTKSDERIAQLSLRASQLEFENRVLQEKAKQLQNQFILLHTISNQYKQKLLSTQSATVAAEVLDRSVILELRKKVKELEIELIDKNQVIDSMGAVLDKFELEFSSKYYKPKFNKEVKDLLVEVTQKVNDLYALLSELRKNETLFEQISTQFEAKKSEINTQRVADKQHIKELEERLQHAQREKQALEQTLHNCRQVINSLKTVQDRSKEAINELENGCSRMKCLNANLEAELEGYKKGLALVADYCEKGVGEKLRNYIKVINDDELKTILRRIYKK